MRTSISRFAMRRAFTVVTLAFLSITLLLGGEVLALRRALQWVDHTDEVIGADQELLKLNIDMETGIRGFLLTEDETFLQPYKEADALMERRFDALNRLVADDAAQKEKLTEIQTQYSDWLRVSNPGTSETRSPPSFFAENSNPGVQLQRKAAMDRIRAAHLAFAIGEENLREQRLNTVRRVKAVVNALLLMVFLLGVSAVLLAFKKPVTLAGQQDASSGAVWNAGRGSKQIWAAQGAFGKSEWKSWMRPVASAVGLPSIAMLLSLSIRPVNPYPFALFFAAVSAVTWIDGMGWGLLALAISLVSADYFFVPPFGDFSLGLHGLVGLTLVGLVQVFLSWLIGNQRQAANALRDQASLLDLSHDCIMMRDLGGQIQFWNHGAEEIYGFSRHEADGKISHELLQTVFPRSQVEIEAELLRDGRWEGELKHIVQDGSHIVVNSRWVLQDERKGAACRVLETNSDISVRKRQENALRRSEDLLNRTGRLAGVGGWELDLVTNEVSWSDETRRLHGFENDYVPTLEEGINFYAPEGRPVIRTAIGQSIADGKDWEVVVPVIRVDSRRIWARVKGTVQFANGKPVRLVGVFQDVTARVAEQEALENANLRTALATESCGIGIWDWELASDRFNCDESIYQFFGLEPQCDRRFDLEFWASRVHPEDRAAVEKGLQDGVAGIKPYDIEFRNVWDDGSVHHMRATGKVIRDQSGAALRMVGTNMDITARKLAEAALRLNNGNEQRLIMGVKDFAILMLDPNGLVTTWNEGAQRIKGYRAEEIVGYHYSKFYPPEAIAEGKPALELQIATEQGRFEEDAWRVRKDGSRFWANVVITALFDTDGKLRGFGKVTRDISDRKAVQDEREKIATELARYTRALERSNLELDAFAYAASHDLKAPLRVIHNASTWIEEDLSGKLTAEMGENMNLLRSRVRRMDRLLDDLLEYSRIGRETDDLHTEAISGAVLMENIQGLISPPEGFIVDASSTMAGIEIFRMPLQQILINLISNAIKHHDKKAGRIQVSVEDLGADWRFSVKDDGPGIPAEYHDKIFKMFQTLKPRDQVEGSGMGLAMVRKHVDVAGGELKLESAVGQGSTFSFTWPKDNGSTNKTKHKFTRIGETS
jgi:PAS domain S-box-containing protein